jgi:transcriptional accessory protein
VKGLGPKAYEQAIGFLRIKEGKEPLDATGIHPDHHKATYAFLEGELGIKKKNLKLPLQMPHYDENQISAFCDKYELGFETMEDIIRELQRPGLDPREEIEKPVFKSDVLDIKDVQIGMKLQGVVRNVTDFGAFVDV